MGAGGPDEFATHTWYPPKRFLHFVLPVMLPPLLLLLLRVTFKLWPDAQTMYVRQREDLSFKSGLVYGIRLSTPRYVGQASQITGNAALNLLISLWKLQQLQLSKADSIVSENQPRRF